MEHVLTVEFGPSRSKRFARAVAEAIGGPGECSEPERGRYRVRFVLGKDAAVYRTRAGIHADGLNKFWWMYAPFDVPKLLGRPLELSFTKDSGLAGLIFLIKQHTGREVTKNDPGLSALHAEL